MSFLLRPSRRPIVLIIGLLLVLLALGNKLNSDKQVGIIKGAVHDESANQPPAEAQTSWDRRPIVLSAVLLLVLLALGARFYSGSQDGISKGAFHDASTSQPLTEVQLSLDRPHTRPDQSDALPLAEVDEQQASQSAVIPTPDYTEAFLAPTADVSQLSLRPSTLSGQVLDELDNPVPGAQVSAPTVSTETDTTGRFVLQDVPQDPTVQISARGYQKTVISPGHAGTVEVRLEPFVARGIYIGFNTLEVPQRRDALVQKAEDLGFNAIILDAKNDSGLVHEAVATPLNREADGVAFQSVNLKETIRRLKDQGFYLIARLNVFKDTPVARLKPDRAVKAGAALYRDCADQLWLDPFIEASWEYNIELAVNAATIGFDEVQFDYVRFPTDCITGALTYSKAPAAAAKLSAIEGFLAQAQARLRPMGVRTSADVFGMTATVEDIGIGQNIEGIAQYVDYVSPMVYPSTWGPGSLGVEYPPAEPYRIVYSSVQAAVERLKGRPVKVRPWLQAFDDYQQQGLAYDAQKIMEQVRASEAAQAQGWMLWDSAGAYPLDQPLRRQQ